MVYRKLACFFIGILLPVVGSADCNWPNGTGVNVLTLTGTGCIGLAVPGDLSTRPAGFGLLFGKVGMWLATSDSFATTAYFGFQKAPTGYVNDFAIVGPSDAGTYRWLRIGYNSGDNPSGTFNSRVAINTYTGAMTVAGPMSIGDVGSGGAPLSVGGDLSSRPLGFGMVLGKPGMWLGTNDNYATSAYFGLQKAPAGYVNDFAIVGAQDAGTYRWLRIGYNSGDNPSSTFNSRVAINTYTGDMTTVGSLGIGIAVPLAKVHAFAATGPVAVRAEMGDLPGTNATMAIDSVIGPYLIAHSNTAGLSTAAYGAHRVTFGAGAFTIAYSPSTPINNVRAWSNHLVIDTVGRVGIGRDTPAVALDVNGDILVSGTLTAQHVIGAQYQDIAEWVPASQTMAPGTVVVVDPRRDNGVIPSASAYDTSVAGVVSAQPGVLLGTAGPSKEQIATTGRVKVRVDASNGAIHLGDLLVTSGKTGLAMRSEPIEFNGRKIHQPGTIIGKALQPLASGEGEILVLLSLQ
jgi:hypothetical protein